MKNLFLLVCISLLATVSAIGQGTSMRSNGGVGTNTTLYGNTSVSNFLFVGGSATVYGAGGVTAQVFTGNDFIGGGTFLTSMNASSFTLGTMPTARLGSGTANSTTFLRGDQTWATPTGETIPAATNIAFARWEKQAATSQTTNFNISVTNSLGRFMSHHIQIEATADVMIHPDCYTNAVLALEVIASGGTRRVSFPTNIAQLNTTGLTLQSVGGTNWYVDVLQNCIFVASIKTNEYYGRRIMTWRTNVW